MSSFPNAPIRADLVKKALRNPELIPSYLLGRLFPDSRWGPNWRREGGYVVFDDGGFAGGDPSRPELSTRIYREVQQLGELLPEERFDRSLEIGCGYGRLSGWIAAHADEAVGVDPNERAIEVARTMHPELAFEATGADEIPFPDDHFDLLVSWAVLQHVPPESIEAVADEISRVLDEDATMVLCEMTSGESGRSNWVRSPAEYESLFDPFEIRTRVERAAEPTFDYADHSETMVLARTDTAYGGASSGSRSVQ